MTSAAVYSAAHRGLYATSRIGETDLATDDIPSFLEIIAARHKAIADCPVTIVTGDGWSGHMITVPPPPGADLAHGLWIKTFDDVVMVGLDHAHFHTRWPPEMRDVAPPWLDATMIVDSILTEQVMAVSGWIGDELRCDTFCFSGWEFELTTPNLNRVRYRSWLGTFDRDEALPGD